MHGGTLYVACWHFNGAIWNVNIGRIPKRNMWIYLHSLWTAYVNYLCRDASQFVVIDFYYDRNRVQSSFCSDCVFYGTSTILLCTKAPSLQTCIPFLNVLNWQTFNLINCITERSHAMRCNWGGCFFCR